VRKIDSEIYEIEDLSEIRLELFPVAAEIWNENFELIDCNQQALDLLEIYDKKIYLNNAHLFYSKLQPCGTPSEKKGRECIIQVMKENRMKCEFTKITSKGEILPVSVTLSKFKHSNKFLVLACFTDLRSFIEATKRTNEAIELNEILLTTSPLIMNIWDENYNLVSTSQQALKMFELESQEQYVERFLELSPEFQPCGTPSSEKALMFVKQAFSEGISQFEWMHQTFDKEQVPTEIIIKRFTYKGVNKAVAFTVDLRPIKAAMDRELALKEESNKAKDKFLANMSHEIRTPISAILGISQIQLQNTDLSNAAKEPYVKIYNSSNLLLSIVNDILDLSKIESRKMDITQEKYDLTNLIISISQLHSAYTTGKDIKFNLNLNENLPLYLVGDIIRIEQIMNNLLSNAFKYTEKGIVELKICCHDGIVLPEQKTVKTQDDIVTLVFSVRDTGLGMTEEQLDLIYQEFASFHKINNSHLRSTGLGMPITHKLIDLMGGAITIESEVGIGTNVSVFLPQKKYGSSIIDKKATLNLQQLELNVETIDNINFSAEWMPYGNMLVVDDIDVNLYVAKGLLGFYGINVETCTSGYDAIDKIKKGKVYDIIFMDHMMPGMDGIETMNIIRDMGYTEPIVALTANAMIGQAETFIEKGFDAFISKPIQVKVLNAILVKYIKEKQPLEVLESISNHRKPSWCKEDVACKDKAIKAIDILEPLLLQRNVKSLEYIQDLRSIPEAAIVVRQIEEFEFSAALKNIAMLRAILEDDI